MRLDGNFSRFRHFRRKDPMTEGGDTGGDKGVSRPVTPMSNKPILAEIPLNWHVTSAANAVNERYVGVRIAGLVLILIAEVVSAVQKCGPKVHFIIVSLAIIYILLADPFVAVGAELSRPTRLICSIALGIVAFTIWHPFWEMILTSISFAVIASFSLRPPVNKRWLMRQNVETNAEVSELINSTEKTKAGEQWQANGRRSMLAMGAIIGSIPRTQADMEAWKLCYYGGYRAAQKEYVALVKAHQDLKKTLAEYRNAESENLSLKEKLDKFDEQKEREIELAKSDLHAEISKLHKTIQVLKQANEELVEALPEENEEDRKAKMIADAKEKGLSNKEIAKILNISVRTVQRRNTKKQERKVE